jgi:hypothetical protein
MSDSTSRVSRRTFLQASAAFAAGGTAVLASHSDDPPAPAADDLITAEAQAAIDRGLHFLAESQSREDGAFANNRTGFGNVAITGLAGLALMAGGHQPGRGKYGAAVSRALDYVLAQGNRSMTSPYPGYLQNPDNQLSHGSMYQHGFGALFLSEVYGMLPDARRQKAVRELLELAVRLTRESQNPDGGWRYEPRPTQADVSVTVAQLMALRAARNAGVLVPKSIVDKCVNYIKACQQRDGGFCYIKGQLSGSAFARSAAAVVGLFCAGIYEGKEIEQGLAYLMRFLPGRRVNLAEARPEHYFYGHYYAALAMWTAGGNYWAEWFPAIRDELVQKTRQTAAQVWTDWHGPAYATAMACIILQLPNNYLPIMQK